MHVCGEVLLESELWDATMTIKGAGLRKAVVEVYHSPCQWDALEEVQEALVQAILTPECLAERLEGIRRK